VLRHFFPFVYPDSAPVLNERESGITLECAPYLREEPVDRGYPPCITSGLRVDLAE
jgi:hypothetical protein